MRVDQVDLQDVHVVRLALKIENDLLRVLGMSCPRIHGTGLDVGPVPGGIALADGERYAPSEKPAVAGVIAGDGELGVAAVALSDGPHKLVIADGTHE